MHVAISHLCLSARVTARVRRFLPGAGVDVVAVKVVHQAVLVGWKRFVSAVDVDAAAASVIGAAVTVAALRNGAFGLRNQPRVGL